MCKSIGLMLICRNDEFSTVSDIDVTATVKRYAKIWHKLNAQSKKYIAQKCGLDLRALAGMIGSYHRKLRIKRKRRKQ